LAAWHFDWDHADSAVEAKAMLSQNNIYDVALIDEDGEGICASEFATKILSDKNTVNCHLILISNKVQQNDQVHLNNGYFCVLKSPINKSLLYNSLHATNIDVDNDNTITRLSDYRREYNPHRQLNILVGEDNATNQKVISKILEFSGHLVSIVNNGEEVLNALEEAAYDLIIMDLHMPVMSGIEAAKIYNFTCFNNEKVPIIILTADATVEAEKDAQKAGVDAYLTKPIDTKKLLSTIFTLTKNASPEILESQATYDIIKTNSVSEISYIDILDINILENLAELSQDIAFMSDLIHGFLNDAKETIDKLSSSSSSPNLQEWQDSLHALKGSSRSMGATTLAIHASVMYEDLRVFNHEKLQDNIKTLRQSYESTHSALLDHLDKLDSAVL
jgi:two-component system sensor histidine kinase RpfC